jgi:HAD superfamily hydrolase (TIGR01484 family)
MKKLILFDVDGTITESGQKITTDMKNTIESLKDMYDIGIVGGGKFVTILLQLNDLKVHHYFSECGCVYHDEHLELQYSKNIRTHELYPHVNTLIKTALHFLSQVDYTLSGHFIDLRNGIVYISLIGLSATLDERKVFIDLDSRFHYRKQLLQLLHQKANELNISSKICICEGGHVGIGIYPIEYDKTQVLPILKHTYNEIHYFGDKYKQDGNDYSIIHHEDVIGHPVNNYNETLYILQNEFI